MRPLSLVQGNTPDYLIVGLGNHGERYKNTRQNIGFVITDHFLVKCLVKKINHRKLHWAFLNKCLFEGQVVFFTKPQMFMENSGMPVEEIMSEYHIKPSRLIVIHDDINLKIGSIKATLVDDKCDHRGVKSIVEHIGSTNFLQIRIGVGPNSDEMTDREHLLSDFSAEELNTIMMKMESLYEFFAYYFHYGFDKAVMLLEN